MWSPAGTPAEARIDDSPAANRRSGEENPPLPAQNGLVNLRRALRSSVPASIRLRIALTRRAVRDGIARPRFAGRHDDPWAYAYRSSDYHLALFDYPGQEPMGVAKRHNQGLVAARLHGVAVMPGETFSFWRLVGRPDSASGFLAATALKEGRLTAEVGGAVCFISTVIYNAALLAGMTITERRAHSLDTYGSERYFELGRDAAVEFGYLDLRFRNDHASPVILLLRAEHDRVVATIAAPIPREFDVDIVVSEPAITLPHTIVRQVPGLPAGSERILHPGYEGVRTTTRRVVRRRDGAVRVDDLGESIHNVAPRVVEKASQPFGAPVR